MEANLLKILFTILCFQLLFVSFFLFQSKKGKTISNKILALVFLMLSVATINFYWIVFDIQTNFSQLMLIDDTFLLAYGPLLYLFTQSVIFKNYILKKVHFIHFIPFFISVFAVIVYILFAEVTSMSETTLQMKSNQVPLYFRMGEMLILFYTLFYLFKSKREVKKVLQSAFEKYSSINQEEFKLLSFIINSFIILFLLAMIHSVLPFIGIRGGLFVTLLLIVLVVFYIINAVLFKMLKQTTNDSGLIAQPVYEHKEKYAGSRLTKTELIKYKSDLWSHMSTQEKYLNSELTIDDLANELALTPKIVSQIINEGYSCNFFDFVNKFRVEEAKSLLSSRADDKMTIQEVMYDAGFNSKSSFNTAFKKFTKLTPTQFKNHI
jgi:AraC-like DNA-binding protein